MPKVSFVSVIKKGQKKEEFEETMSIMREKRKKKIKGLRAQW